MLIVDGCRIRGLSVGMIVLHGHVEKVALSRPPWEKARLCRARMGSWLHPLCTDTPVFRARARAGESGRGEVDGLGEEAGSNSGRLRCRTAVLLPIPDLATPPYKHWWVYDEWTDCASQPLKAAIHAITAFLVLLTRGMNACCTTADSCQAAMEVAHHRGLTTHVSCFQLGISSTAQSATRKTNGRQTV